MESISDDDWDSWDASLTWVGEYLARGEIFKSPEVLTYMSQLQDYLQGTGLVGKSNSLTDVVKTVHRELFMGNPENYRIPDSRGRVRRNPDDLSE